VKARGRVCTVEDESMMDAYMVARSNIERCGKANLVGIIVHGLMALLLDMLSGQQRMDAAATRECVTRCEEYRHV
jgi:hypothetical protein